MMDAKLPQLAAGPTLPWLWYLLLLHHVGRPPSLVNNLQFLQAIATHRPAVARSDRLGETGCLANRRGEVICQMCDPVRLCMAAMPRCRHGRAGAQLEHYCIYFITSVIYSCPSTEALLLPKYQDDKKAANTPHATAVVEAPAHARNNEPWSATTQLPLSSAQKPQSTSRAAANLQRIKGGSDPLRGCSCTVLEGNPGYKSQKKQQQERPDFCNLGSPPERCMAAAVGNDAKFTLQTLLPDELLRPMTH